MRSEISDNSTIYALSSARGIAGVAVVRVSGPLAVSSLQKLISECLPCERMLVVREIKHPESGALIDRGMVAYFQAPRSFTGEDVVEYHVHGSLAVVEVLLSALSELGLKPAEAGEFTKRSFENGKLDLTQVEGLSDLLLAQTEGQHAQAIQQMEGALRQKYEDWRGRLIQIMALIEASIDFPDEDLPEDILDEIDREISLIRAEVSDCLDNGEIGQSIREGLRVAVVGPPNVGKSSLLNVLANRDAAIVSEEAGTTRDVIEVPMNLAGVPVIFSDTAGVRATGNAIEQEGVKRAKNAARRAHYRLWVKEAICDWPDDFKADYQELRQSQDFVVINKIDLLKQDQASKSEDGNTYLLSTVTGEGVTDFLQAFTGEIETSFSTSDVPMVTRERQKLVLEEFLSHLSPSTKVADMDIALFAEELRFALTALGRLAGRVDVEDILDVIFREFCIGK